VTVEPAEAAAALAESWRFLCASVSGGWASSAPGATAGVTGVANPTLNGVLVQSSDADPAEVAGLVEEVRATGLPFFLQCRPAMEARLGEVAAARAMTREDHDTPLMARHRTDGALPPDLPEGLVIRELSPDEAPLHADVAAVGFEAPVEEFRRLMTPSMLALPEVRGYLGEVDGVPVTTGLGVRVGPSVAVFNIATPAEHRRRGYGAAVTARIVADGLASGATWAWLQSSQAGFHVYEGLGFSTIEAWPCWLMTGADGS
jgi:ribosomal protein S18 acetylase RimI-like enzyme